VNDSLLHSPRLDQIQYPW